MKNPLKKSGQSLIEFALIIPIFVVMVMFIFDVGRAVYYYSVLYNACREGARAAAVEFPDINDIPVYKGIVVDRAYGMDLDFGDVTVTWPNPPGNTVRVAAEYDFIPLTPATSFFMQGGKLDMDVEAVMRLEFD